MTYWRTMAQLRRESSLEGRTELVLDGVKRTQPHSLILALKLGLVLAGAYAAMVIIVNLVIY
ncbi:TPA: hypothetical protein HA259_00415 [Thermoplasmata archaeon]|nr:hypothetical protein [Thermoplasmata archaeon]